MLSLMSMLVYIEMVSNEMMLAFGGRTSLSSSCFRVEVGRLAGDDGLECII